MNRDSHSLDAFYRPRPEIRKSASSILPSSFEGVWNLGNIHNFPVLVRTTMLFSNLENKFEWTPASDRFHNVASCESVYELATSAAEDFQHNYRSMTKATADGDQFGLFKYRIDEARSGAFDEQRLSMAFTVAFDNFLQAAGCTNIIFGAREQLDAVTQNSQDYVLDKVFEGGTLPLVVVEFANATGAHRDCKEAQLFTHVSNNTHLLPEGKSPLNLGVSFCNLKSSPSFQLFGYYQVEGTTFHVVPMTGELPATETNVANLFFATLAFTLHFTLDKLPDCSPLSQDLEFLQGYGGLLQMDIGGTRRCVKVMNYANFYPLQIDNGGRGKLPTVERRKVEFTERMLAGATTWNVGDDISGVVYDYIEGNHDADHSECLLHCIKHLAAAHDQDILHCDLHLGNFVFNSDEPEKSLIIDWDHARSLSKPGKYVCGWLHDLPERHPLARAGCPIKMEHERHSLAEVLKRFAPVEEANTARWLDICNDASTVECSLVDLIDSVNAISYKLKFVNGETPVTVQTGSPPRKDQAMESIAENVASMEI